MQISGNFSMMPDQINLEDEIKESQWLHKTKIFSKKGNNNGMKINLKINDNKAPVSNFFDKNNYLSLKQKLGKKIREEVMEKSGEISEVHKKLLDEIVPDSSKVIIMKKKNKTNLSVKIKK